MKLKNAIIALIASLSLGLFLNSCEPTDGPVTPSDTTKTKLAAVTNLQASSVSTVENKKDVHSVIVRFTIPADTTKSAGYRLYFNGNVLKEFPENNTNQITINDVPMDQVVKIGVEVIAKDTSKYIDSDIKLIEWAGAYQTAVDYAALDLTIAESASTMYGSGLQIYDSGKNGARVLKIADIEDWTVGVYTKGNSFEFGPASKLNGGSGNYAKNKKNVEISGPYSYDNFEDWFDNKSLDNLTYTTNPYDLADHTVNKNAIFVVREKVGNEYYYSKVMLVKKDGAFYSGSAPNRAFTVKLSFQKKAGIPYAKTAKN